MADHRDESAEWDERYASAEQVWSGEPNNALRQEVADLHPGRALDVGCGEGADAICLASMGWEVTALDVAEVALSRARSRAADAGVSITWMHSGMLDAGLPTNGFDLVSAQYPALRRTPHDAEHALVRTMRRMSYSAQHEPLAEPLVTPLMPPRSSCVTPRKPTPGSSLARLGRTEARSTQNS